MIEGDLDFGVEGQVKQLQKGDLIALAPKVPHDLKANANSIVRLTLSKSDQAKRVQVVANHSG